MEEYMAVAGLDVHKRVVEACVLDQEGKAVAARMRFGCTRPELERFARTHLSPAHQVALEATTNTWAIADALRPLVAEVVVSNPLRTRAIAEAKVKTDKVDAEVLARLLAADFLPRVWAPDHKTRLLRHLTGRRAALVAGRTRIKNRIHALLHQRLIVAPGNKELFGAAGRRWLESTVALDEPGRAALDSELRLLDATAAEIEAIEGEIARHGYADERVKLLMTLPGVDVAVAETLLAALGDIGRFVDGDHAAGYLGIVPSTRQSGDHCYHGPITKRGRGHARWMMIQAAQHLDSHPGPLGVFFRRLARKKNRNVAVVATARKMVVIAWHMLKKGEPYRYAQPRPTAQKLARLRVRATGKRKRGGNAKGAPRPEAYGSGRPTRAIPALGAVYAAEGLPALSAASPGERKLIERDELRAAHLAQIESAHRIARRRKLTPVPES
jgi:transposase